MLCKTVNLNTYIIIIIIVVVLIVIMIIMILHLYRHHCHHWQGDRDHQISNWVEFERASNCIASALRDKVDLNTFPPQIFAQSLTARISTSVNFAFLKMVKSISAKAGAFLAYLLKSKLFGCNRSQGVTCIHVKGDRSSSKEKECLPVQQSDYDVGSNNNRGGSSNCLLASGWPDTQIDIARNRYESRAGKDMKTFTWWSKSLNL